MDEFRLIDQRVKNLRDDVAKFALQGLLATGDYVYEKDFVEEVTAKAFDIADAWMKEREKR